MINQNNSMRKNILDLFNVTYTNSVTSSHIVFSTQSDTEFYAYQLEMILHNQKNLKNIILPDYRKRDHLLDFFYEITSKTTLTDYLLKNVLSKKDVLDILLTIAETLDQCESYLLSADKFILDTDYIYIDTKSHAISLIYIPLKESFDQITQFKNFLISFISVKAKISTDYADNYTQRILEFIKDDNVTIHGIKEMMHQLNTTPSVSTRKENTSKEEDKEQAYQYIKSKVDSEKNKSAKKNVHKRSFLPMGGENIKIPKGSTVEQESKPMEMKPRNNTIGEFSVWIILGFLVMTFLLGIFLILQKSEAQKELKILGLLIVFIGVGYIANKKLDFFGKIKMGIGKTSHKEAVKQSEDQPKTDIQKEKSVSRQRQINIPIPVLQFLKSDQEEIRSDEISEKSEVNVPDSAIAMNTSVIAEPREQMNTVVLSGNNKRKILYLVNTGTNSKIFINTSPFVIGRIKEFSDFAVKNPAIGKSHCEISYDESDVYVKDLDSKNGTYINDIKLEAQSIVPIKDGDRLTIANESFIVKCQ